MLPSLVCDASAACLCSKRQLQSLRAPKQLGDGQQIYTRICSGSPECREVNRPSFSDGRDDDTPVTRNAAANATHEPDSDHNRHAVENSVVRSDLSIQSAQRVLIAFDFVAYESPVDDSDVSSARAMPDSKLIDNERVRSHMVEAKDLAMNSFPDLFVVGVHDIGHARSKDFADTCRDNRACCRFKRKKTAG
jgi:hypothetical protein